MNLQLLDPTSSHDFPDAIEETVDDGSATLCSFNRRGTLLAIGCSVGRVCIWDFDTKSTARIMSGHIHPVTSVSWSKNGRKLLSSSTDWTIIVWDVLTSAIDITIKFDSAVLSAKMHPEDNSLAIACPLYSVPYLVNVTSGQKTALPQLTPEQIQKAVQELGQKLSNAKYETSMVAAFTQTGDKIFTGDSKGFITIVSVATLKIDKFFRVPGGAAIKAIDFSKNEKFFVVNSTDRIIRLFDAKTHVLIREFQDLVNRMQWKKCCFSSNSEYIIGGSAQKSSHNIYIWSQAGGIVKNLEGPKEGIMDLEWHPMRPIIASCSTRGAVYIWNTTYQENWSAFAPDFQELEENEEYIEREDEFDEVDEVEKMRETEPEEEVDVVTLDGSDFNVGDEGDLFFLPTVPERDA
eukprot:TRINITY_DN5513_c0_g1_i1.p1 TRINITY_DN5513_c0_g1~~TRINITY_DN5513_c0_g1_i1.p1  ORF type:complete len:406 (+),score=79.03 TRINITY_DN5513_c0_g1_i1:58-1275(+)